MYPAPRLRNLMWALPWCKAKAGSKRQSLLTHKMGLLCFLSHFQLHNMRNTGSCTSIPCWGHVPVTAHYSLIKCESNNEKFHMLWKCVAVKAEAQRHQSCWSISSTWKAYVLTIKPQMIVLPPDKYCHNPELCISPRQALLTCYSLPSEGTLHSDQRAAACTSFSTLRSGQHHPTLQKRTWNTSRVFPKQLRWHLTLLPCS